MLHTTFGTNNINALSLKRGLSMATFKTMQTQMIKNVQSAKQELKSTAVKISLFTERASRLSLFIKLQQII